MKILAFDTSSTASSVALYCGEATYSVHELNSIKQGTHLLPIIANLLKEASISLKDLDVIALGVGPGSFTGLRIGCSAAQAMGMAHGIPIIAVSSLQLLAQTAYQRYGDKHFLVAVDARKDHAYCGHYKLDDAYNYVQLIGKEILLNLTGVPHELAAKNSEEDQEERFKFESHPLTTMCIGNAWTLYEKPLLSHFQCIQKASSLNEALLPNASAMFGIVLHAYKKRQWVEPMDLVPRYLNDMLFSITF